MERGGRYLGLDGLRGVAAIMVVLYHCKIVALHGYLSVDLFFLMSGLVIASTYEPRFARGAIGLRAYMAQRAARLYPMLFLGGVLGLVFVTAGLVAYRPQDEADLLMATIGQFTLIPFLAFAAVPFPLNNPQWTVVWELIANAAHATGLWRVKARGLVPIVGIAAVVLLYYGATEWSLCRGISPDTLPAGLARCAFGFFGGVLLYRTRESWQPRMPRVHFALPAMLLALVTSMPPSLVPPGLGFGLYDVFLVVFVFPPLVMLAAQARAGSGAEALGQMSYPLYALSEPVIFWLFERGSSQNTMIAGTAAMCAASWAMGRWVDAPLNALRHARRRARQVEAAPAGVLQAA
ncbi:acyltransferase family protein [Parablastomonas sp. CN1-191]|uniref:acyltransferase family protein n=1 Tax=Parablastomonas sp. CN1-191 TaxID=3400908 RepID=UPI003BF8B762